MRSTRDKTPDEQATWRGRIAGLQTVGPLLRMVWKTSPGLVTAIAFLRAIRAVTPLGFLWISKLILDALVAVIIRHNGNLSRLYELIGLEFLIAAGAGSLNRANGLLGTILSDRFNNQLSVRVMEHASTLDLSSFEDPAFQDKLDRARRQCSGRAKMLVSVSSICQDALSLALLSFSLAAFSPWLLLLLSACILPTFIGESHFAKLAYSLLYRRTPERRGLDYLRYLGASTQSCKEVKVFGLSNYFVETYRTTSEALEVENEALAVRGAIAGACLNLVSTAGYYVCYIAVLMKAVSGDFTVGMCGFVVAAFSRSSSYIERILSSVSDLSQDALSLKDLFDFLDIKPAITASAGARPAPRPIRVGFEFQGVSFAYPGSDRLVLRSIDLRLNVSEKIAIVGENGAGKTTLIKLLTRLYEPTAGRILLDGVDLREYDLNDLRREISVTFQDFLRYDLAVRDNIGFGRLEFRTDETNLESAAKKSLAMRLIDRFPNRYDQILGKRFEGGVELSGGEWQKLALARSYIRDAQVLILDEPTASLDARAERHLYERFVESTRGRMAVLVSHRFSTVRMADRILVFADGTVEEEGTHETLVRRGGRYAQLFEMQAASYR